MALNPFWPTAAVAVAFLIAVALPAVRQRRSSVALWRRLGIGVLVLLAALRPSVATAPSSTAVRDLDVVFLVDRSLSMVAEDYAGSEPRLAGVRADAAEIMNGYAGARFAVVTFDHSGRTETPFTLDTSAVASLLEVTNPRQIYQRGSSIDAGLAETEKLLKSSAKQHPERSRVLIYFGDGEQTVETAPGSMAPLRRYLSGALVLGYGTAAGGKMRLDDGSYLDGGEAVSVYDESTLAAMADQLGGSFAHRTSPGPVPTPTVTATVSLVNGQLDARDDWTWLFAVLLLGPVLWELWDSLTLRRQASQWAASAPKKRGRT